MSAERAPARRGSTSRVASRGSQSRTFDRDYFDRWYRHPRHRVKTANELRRQVRFVLYTAEWVLGRRVRRVLDVGCGEGQWAPELKRIDPGLRYTGVDASQYAVRRFGRRRHIKLGTLEALDRVGLRGEFDLVLCVGVLNYLDARAVRAGLRHLHGLAGGLVYLEVFTSQDADVVGDTRNAHMYSPDWYRRAIADAGFVSCGLQCYLPDWLRGYTASMEQRG